MFQTGCMALKKWPEGWNLASKFERVLCAAFGLELYSGNYNDCKKLTGSAGKDCNQWWTVILSAI